MGTDTSTIDSALEIRWEPYGKRGRVALAAHWGDELVHTDKIDPSLAKSRRVFAADLCRDREGIDPAEVEAQLLAIVAKLEQSSKDRRPRASHDEVPAPRDGRPQIVITHEEHEVIDEAVKALCLDQTIYQRGNMLVTVLHDAPRGDQVARPSGSPRVAPLPSPRLRERMTKHAEWYKLRKLRDGGFEPVHAHPPDWSVSGVAARGEWEGIRHLDAVIEAPTIRPDGTILDGPGWDQTGLLYEPNAEFPQIPNRLALADAKRAAETLLELVVDFPFASIGQDGGQTHKAAWLAAMLTPLARFAIFGPCPLFVFDANSPGTGKSKLTDLIAIVSTGRDMPRTTYPDSDEEMRKRITSIALAGDRIILIDNIALAFGGPALDSALTATTWRDRILGRSELTADLPLFTVWYATGNNMTLKGDVLRRVILSRLETTRERPEERTGFAIEGDLLEYARRERPRLVAAGLTLLRAHALAGRPNGGLAPLGSYESWSQVVRSAIYWAISIDPCASRDQLRASDPETIARNALVQGWAELPDAKLGLTVAAAIKAVRDATPPRYDLLRGAMMEFSRNDDLPSPCAVSSRLKRIKDRVVGTQAIRATSYQGTQLWRVEEVEPVRGVHGVGGVDPEPRAKTSREIIPTENRDRGAKEPHQPNQPHGATGRRREAI